MNNITLDQLFASVATIKNVGDKHQASLKRIGCEKVIDLVFHLPCNLIKYEYLPDLSKLYNSRNIITKLSLSSMSDNGYYRSRRSVFKIICHNQTGGITLAYFNYYPSYLENKIKQNNEIIIKGKAERFHGELTMSHPEILSSDSNIDPYEAIYPLTYGLLNKQLSNMIIEALKKLPKFDEWLDGQTIEENSFPSFNQAIIKCHNPKNIQALDPLYLPRKRLAFDELLANQLAVKLVRQKSLNGKKGVALDFPDNISDDLIAKLPFMLTDCQKKAIEDISNDQRSTHRMMRLIQGDVGSGKTIIALISMLNVVYVGKQACMMAPTDLLATQHYNSISEVLKDSNIKVGLISGKIKGKERKLFLEQLQNNELDLVIGTHAIFQDQIIFNDLALIVIDEQHRFGVEQRLALADKNPNSDILIMSATPIPRTLTMVLYGDISISKIMQKPANRLPIITSVLPISKERELIESIHKILAKSEKIYWICPLIEENIDEDSNRKQLKAAISRYNDLRAEFGDIVGLVHGQMKDTEKEEVMLGFASGDLKILVATTVIEVGIDVKEATLIIIEHAERFGLSQLHQLRGRVGRSHRQSYCILLYHFPVTEIAKERLSIIKKTNDGFVISEEDLRLRGAGELLGTKQSGLADFKFVDFILHQDLFSKTGEIANSIIAEDPELQEPKHQSLKMLLRIFGYHQCLKYLKS